jgi:hypothetical protein
MKKGDGPHKNESKIFEGRRKFYGAKRGGGEVDRSLDNG